MFFSSPAQALSVASPPSPTLPASSSRSAAAGSTPDGASEAELNGRALASLYNQLPTWLDLPHKRFDAAVFAAYEWPKELGDEDVLERLLALNLERAEVGKKPGDD